MGDNDKPLRGMKIGFAGLGLMGRPMARHLHTAGATLSVWNRTATVAQDLALPGARVCDTPSSLAAASDIVVLMLADTDAVRQVLFDANGLYEGLGDAGLVIDMGTTAVMPTREFAKTLNEIGSDYVDAPVSGGEIGAIEASLAIMAGGSDQAIARARPLFDVLGRRFTHIGGIGAGQVAKAANQVIVGLNIGAVAEALALAEAAGIDPARVREALMGGFAASRVLEVHGQRMIDCAFTPGGRVRTQHKDMRQACELAESLDQPMPATRLGSDLYMQMIDRGDGDLDHSALIRLFRTV